MTAATRALFSTKVLVLNQSWIPIDLKIAYDAICDLWSGKADVVGSDYLLHDFESWVHTWDDAAKLSKVASEKVIGTSSGNVVIPEVIKMKEYNGFFVRRPRVTRAGIFLRDNNTCQYCGKKKHPNDLNVDHVFPEARGGRNTWKNLVLSCVDCNNRKGCRTPEEAGMTLRRPPKEPHWTTIKEHFTMRNAPKSWEDFLGKLYWNVELEE